MTTKRQPNPAKRSRKTAKAIQLNIRISPSEKVAFERCAEVYGISLSAWMRERLRAASLRDLDSIGELSPFLSSCPTCQVEPRKFGKDRKGKVHFTRPGRMARGGRVDYPHFDDSGGIGIPTRRIAA